MRRLATALITCLAAAASAQSAAVVDSAASPETPPPAPVSMPWSLRSVAPANVVRSDSSAATYVDKAGNPGSTGVSFLYASQKLTPYLAPWVKVGVVGSNPPGGATAMSFVNPALGLNGYLPAKGSFRGAASFGLALPIAMGGGNSPDPALAAATKAGVIARSSMDNAMFAMNDTVLFPGVDVAFVRWGLTLQAEATVLFLIRSRGEAVQPDAFKMNLTSGVHAGYALTRWLSLGTDFRYQRWLVPPKSVTAATLSQASLAIGPRFDFQVGAVRLRPGLSYAFGFDAPMSTSKYNVVQLDVPVVF
jgi:hypothetical protein